MVATDICIASSSSSSVDLKQVGFGISRPTCSKSIGFILVWIKIDAGHKASQDGHRFDSNSKVAMLEGL